jgi:hypothetical protein
MANVGLTVDDGSWAMGYGNGYRALGNGNTAYNALERAVAFSTALNTLSPCFDALRS